MPGKGNFLGCVTLNGQKEVLITSNVLRTLNKEVRVLCAAQKKIPSVLRESKITVTLK